MHIGMRWVLHVHSDIDMCMRYDLHMACERLVAVICMCACCMSVCLCLLHVACCTYSSKNFSNSGMAPTPSGSFTRASAGEGETCVHHACNTQRRQQHAAAGTAGAEIQMHTPGCMDRQGRQPQQHAHPCGKRACTTHEHHLRPAAACMMLLSMWYEC